MPFTIGGDWIPNKPEKEKPKRPVKVRLLKRKNSLITVILNLSIEKEEMKHLASLIKQKLGVGGSIKNDTIEIQGDKVSEIKKVLKSNGIKSS